VQLPTAALIRLLETVQQFRKGQASFGDVLDAFPDVADPDLDQLEDLLEHEPRAGGLFGVSQEVWKEYQADIATVLERLRARVEAASSDPHAG
jgi:hypothetical protein